MTNKNKIREAYQILHRESDIEVGDRVKVLRKARDYEMGWSNTWIANMDSFVGKIAIVENDYPDSGFVLSYSNNPQKKYFCFPFFVLEKIEAKSITNRCIKDLTELVSYLEEIKEVLGILTKGVRC